MYFQEEIFLASLKTNYKSRLFFHMRDKTNTYILTHSCIHARACAET